MNLIDIISGFISYCPCPFKLLHCVCLLFCFGSKLTVCASLQCKKSGYFGAGYCSWDYIGQAPGFHWLLCCCLLALLVGDWVEWWSCDAVLCWVAGVSVLARFQEFVSVWSPLLVLCRTSIIVDYSMLY